ncbi:Crp/Fnr family transcriptional regulator [Calothrix sp. PCC 7507]|uniref:Crp/Fnr family transcriptional regulator n=1 Tax=Calothrix sp. PCC 7507 TaxID=99598 RepID=UPI00029F04FB|nr:Crp/Fnr family transcriptional regulator [Calothrix sp. PCC 7507]AFY35750.1 putative transcriptional regulator, Crp/Fnr family [Calothrix sp. PCC 7507]
MLSPVVTLSIFQKQPNPQVFSAGQVIFAEGEPGEFIYGILEGEVDVLVNGKVVEAIETGEVFGAGVLVGVKNRTYTAVAKTDTKLAFLDEETFLFAVQETPVFALKVMKSYSERLSRVERELASLSV